MEKEPVLLTAIRRLQNPIPQYVLGTIPAIAIMGISKAAGPCMDDKSLEDWPYLLLLFIWTLPIIYIRIRKGRVVDRVLEGLLHDPPNTDLPLNDHNNKQAHASITALAAVVLPWLAVVIAYYTRPIGFFCWNNEYYLQNISKNNLDIYVLRIKDSTKLESKKNCIFISSIRLFYFYSLITIPLNDIVIIGDGYFTIPIIIFIIFGMSIFIPFSIYDIIFYIRNSIDDKEREIIEDILTGIIY
ncbi:23244_t:CDS:2 [Gigaspora margarita]|uniref:23244_t:CDS:1 n=1 Tax=Gigaspora margarita TaxID=4874 RepID=A0ABN7UYU5_GIGMA|nr:23244_t:CDS:2 [Gigaspora margarita]